MCPVKATKWCPSCKSYVEIDGGWWGNVRRFDGLQATCILCQKAEMKLRRKRTAKRYERKVDPFIGLKGKAGRKALRAFVAGDDTLNGYTQNSAEDEKLLKAFLNEEDL